MGFSAVIQYDAFWIEYVGYLLVLVCIVLGRGLGAAMDWREEDHDALVKRG